MPSDAKWVRAHLGEALAGGDVDELGARDTVLGDVGLGALGVEPPLPHLVGRVRARVGVEAWAGAVVGDVDAQVARLLDEERHGVVERP
jgi:hypothetical protein